MTLRPGLELVAIEHASRELAEAETLSELKEIRDRAEAVRKYAQSAAIGLEAQNRAAEVKLRAERKAGQLLAKLPLRGGDRKSNNHKDCLKLEDLGISQNQSTRWQLQARLSDTEFEQYLRAARDAGREISTSGLLRLARLGPQAGKRHDVVVIDAPLRSLGATTTRRVGGPGDVHGLLAGISDGLIELASHRELLAQLLEPLIGEGAELLPAQRRVLGHILAEMKTLIHEMRHTGLARLASAGSLFGERCQTGSEETTIQVSMAR